MKLRRLLVAASLLVTACNSNLGLDNPECNTRDVANTHILAAQAVPTARYIPCIDELRLGWDSIDWYARRGESGIRFMHSLDTFLTVRVTASCDVSGAAAVDGPTSFPDVQRFEAVEFVPAEIPITIVPSGEGQLEDVREDVEELEEAGPVDIEDRTVRFHIDQEFDLDVGARVKRALDADHYVWIVSALDAEEGTLELRSNTPAVAGAGMTAADALDLIESFVPELHYRGNWFFTFEGGCITYEFSAEGIVAATVAADANEAIGFFPAFQMRRIFRLGGFDIE